MTSAIQASSSGASMFGLISTIARPTSPGMRLNAIRALGVKRLTFRSRLTITIGMSALVTRFWRSLLSSCTSW